MNSLSYTLKQPDSIIQSKQLIYEQTKEQTKLLNPPAIYSTNKTSVSFHNERDTIYKPPFSFTTPAWYCHFFCHCFVKWMKLDPSVFSATIHKELILFRSTSHCLNSRAYTWDWFFTRFCFIIQKNSFSIMDQLQNFVHHCFANWDKEFLQAWQPLHFFVGAPRNLKSIYHHYLSELW